MRIGGGGGGGERMMLDEWREGGKKGREGGRETKFTYIIIQTLHASSLLSLHHHHHHHYHDHDHDHHFCFANFIISY